MLVTRLGVSVLKVVATIEMPTSHQGAARPEVKNSVVLELARRQKKSAGRNEIAILAAMIDQSSVVKGKPVIGQPARGEDQFPRVKSGNFIGALPFATDISVSGNGALQVAASYTS